MFGSLKVGIGKQKKHLLQLSLSEIVWQVFHGVRAQAAYIAIATWVHFPQRLNKLNSSFSYPDIQKAGTNIFSWTNMA